MDFKRVSSCIDQKLPSQHSLTVPEAKWRSRRTSGRSDDLLALHGTGFEFRITLPRLDIQFCPTILPIAGDKEIKWIQTITKSISLKPMQNPQVLVPLSMLSYCSVIAHPVSAESVDSVEPGLTITEQY